MPTASVSRRANVLPWRAELREMVGEAEGEGQESRDKHLTDLEEHQETNLMTLPPRNNTSMTRNIHQLLLFNDDQQ